ncbi:hypothetical protein OHA72_41180 [Dactylosporangium sp. NBC_01737]|uniref:hypothetical protein n=1 Tax=Dactylosporangium sp. NBC_01737 TaxID=2975959 RepID=UPI002E0F368D|nr:hypothetical protein OHA72_41180 [Dactylosporangium sp. NBC_01737]
MTSIIAGSIVRSTARTHEIEEDHMDDRRNRTPDDRGGGRWRPVGIADAVTVVAVLAAVFGLAALALTRGAGPAQIGAMVLVVATAAGRLLHRIRRAATQWGSPAATEDPRPQTAEPLSRPDREHVGPRDRGVTGCGDVTALLSARPRPGGAVPSLVKPVTHADTVTVDGPVGAGHSTTRPGTGE